MKYQVIIRKEFEDIDDIAARQKAQELITALNIPDGSIIKFQRVEEYRSPQGLEL